MAYSYYMPENVCSYCPYMMGGYVQQIPYTDGEQRETDKEAGDTEITYDNSQYRILPLLTIPFLFAAAGASRPYYGPGPFWGPPPYFYNYWYFYR